MLSGKSREKVTVVLTDDLDQQKMASREKQLENIRRLRGRFKGSLSTSEDFAARKALEKELEL